MEACEGPARTLLELGSGGGNNASHLKRRFAMTLVDLSPEMLEVSRQVNPECEHLEGDTREVRLERQFDGVFIQDAISHMTTEADLRKVMETAYLHCLPGGAAVFMPDFVRENFRPSTGCDGHDAGGRGLRYLEWTWDPDPGDSCYTADFAYLVRDEHGTVTALHDRLLLGLFGRAQWLRWLEAAGFEARAVPLQVAGVEPGRHEIFVARRPKS